MFASCSPCAMMSQSLPRLWFNFLEENKTESMIEVGNYGQENDPSTPAILEQAIERIGHNQKQPQLIRTQSMPYMDMDAPQSPAVGILKKERSLSSLRSVSFDDLRYVGHTHTRQEYSRGQKVVIRKEDVPIVRHELDTFKKTEMKIHPDSKDNTLVYSELAKKRRNWSRRKRASLENFDRVYSSDGKSDSAAETAPNNRNSYTRSLLSSQCNSLPPVTKGFAINSINIERTTSLPSSSSDQDIVISDNEDDDDDDGTM
eukprot:Awhi_evm1s1050